MLENAFIFIKCVEKRYYSIIAFPYDFPNLIAEASRLSACKLNKWLTQISKRVLFDIGRRWKRRIWKFSVNSFHCFSSKLGILICFFWCLGGNPVNSKSFSESVETTMEILSNQLSRLVKVAISDVFDLLCWQQTCIRRPSVVSRNMSSIQMSNETYSNWNDKTLDHDFNVNSLVLAPLF